MRLINYKHIYDFKTKMKKLTTAARPCIELEFAQPRAGAATTELSPTK